MNLAPGRMPSERKRPSFMLQGGSTMPERVRGIFHAAAVSLLNPETRVLACRIVETCAARDDRCEVERIAAYLSRSITYRGEIPGFDLMQTLARSLDLRAGDCDCFVVAGIALYSELGYVSGARIVMWSATDGHTYNLLRLPRLARSNAQQTVPVDLSEGTKPGLEPSLAAAISVQDYWFDPPAYMAWAASGRPITDAPLPTPRRPG